MQIKSISNTGIYKTAKKNSFAGEKNYPNFTSNDNASAPKADEAQKAGQKENFKKFLPIAGVAAAGILAATIYFLSAGKGKSKPVIQANALQETIKNALDKNPELKSKTDALVEERFSFKNIPGIVNKKSEDFQDLDNFRYMLAMDAAGGAPEEIQIPSLAVFKKIDTDTFSKLKEILFGTFKLRHYEIEYDGNVADVMSKLHTISQENPIERLFVDIKDGKGVIFARDIKNDESVRKSFTEFFRTIKDKKITFITSNSSTADYISKLPEKPGARIFNYNIDNLSNFRKTYLDINA